MAGAFTYIFASLGVVLALLGGYVYTFGIPAEWKRAAEEKALETMGENKASYMMKDAIGKVPEGDAKELKDLKSGLSNLGGGALQNPLGKFGGNTADDVTKDFTGR